jgi:hypothetical protein
MISYFDDFLLGTQFVPLNQKMLKRYKHGLRQDIGHTNFPSENQAVRIRTSSNDHDYTESKVLLGIEIVPAIEKMRETLLTLGYVDPMAYSVWYQYGDKNHLVGKHFDSTVRNSAPEKSLSTFLYTHNCWEDDWGGEFCVNSAEVLPKPNRLIVYSRDEEHWINSIKHTLEDNYMRMFFGVSWSTQ